MMNQFYRKLWGKICKIQNKTDLSNFSKSLFTFSLIGTFSDKLTQPFHETEVIWLSGDSSCLKMLSIHFIGEDK